MTDPDFTPIINDYLADRLDADQLDLYLDVKHRPTKLHALVEAGVYDVWDARRAVIQTYGGFIPPLWAGPNDGSIFFMGRPL